MKTLFSALVAITCVGMSACSSVQHHERYAGPVQSANAEDVRHCEFLGNLSSSSGLTGLFAPKGVDNIKQNLLRQADAMGATHIVWDKATAGYESTTLSGKAYNCPPEKSPNASTH
jgi:hypothetical protein